MTKIKRNLIRRQQILETALQMFARYGYKKASLDDIAKAMSVVKGALYHYFPDKESIFSEIVNMEAGKVIKQLEIVALKQVNPKQKLLNFIKKRIEIQRETAKRTNVTKESFYEMHSILFSIMERYYNKQEQKLLTIILKEGVQKKVFRKINIPVLAEIISNYLHSQESLWVFDASESALIRNKIKVACDLLLRGIEVCHEDK